MSLIAWSKRMNSISYPATRRRLIAAAIFIAGGVLTVVVKLVRHQIDTGLPVWVMDSLPNFICGMVVPFVILAGDRAFRFADFALFCGLSALGLIAYELLQLVMPRRTFELNDIVATAAGALLAMALGRMIFFRNVFLTVNSDSKTRSNHSPASTAPPNHSTP